MKDFTSPQGCFLYRNSVETLCEERKVTLPILLPEREVNSQSFVNVNTRNNYAHCYMWNGLCPLCLSRSIA